MRNYVVGLGQERDQRILFVRKKRPEWQTGKLNLPGGKVEIGEEPREAMYRELREETGYVCGELVLYGKAEGDDYQIWCYKLDSLQRDASFYCEDVESHSWFKAQRLSALIGNLRIIIPLILSGTKNWVLHDFIPDSERTPDKDFGYYLNFRGINDNIRLDLPKPSVQAELLKEITNG